MDQIKIGKFIAQKRKDKGLTQMQLAEKLCVTDRAVSKWERGISMPDYSIIIDLCKELKISVNDLLSGEDVSMENYIEKTEQNLLEMVKQKEQADKRLLNMEIVIGCLSVFILLSLNFIAALIQMENWLRIMLCIVGFVVGMIGIAFALKIEQIAGYYECGKCGHKYVPSYKSVFFAMHVNRTRYMRCPECNKKSWSKKVLTK